MGNSISDLIKEFGTILEDERRVLLAGAPAEIDAIVRRKLQLAEALESAAGAAPADPAAVERLARYNQENAIICNAMLRHLTAAIDNLRRLDLHRSYNPDGSEQAPPTRHALGAA